ncbi:CD209 antigen-like protein C isoform X11 [Sparus aurata]|uniref:CD209 antigen-like protein C isoform X11 n=1 Tax=Sparus aurata TaxID=8175 RepID=UPI0011C1551C|nr:CD209 antigen-like protein C isoform X11 [Sparus aurata]
MSAEILAAPDSSFNVRFIRRENRGEGEEMEVEILEDEEHHADLGSQQARPNTEQNGAAVKRRCFRAPAVTLGVMYLLMLAGIYIRYILLTLEKDQLRKNNTQLQERVSDVIFNNSQLLSSYETLSKNHIQLQGEVKKLKKKIEEKWCPNGWKRFGCSCYFRSNQMKTWSQSRTDCQNKGADLVVINNKDENKFVSELNNMNEESWIGLETEWSTGRSSYERKWVDGSPLTETFWASGLPAATSYQYAASCNQQGQWTQSYDDYTEYYICEKRVSCIL